MSHFDYHTLRLENIVLVISLILTDNIDKARNYTRCSLKSRHKLTLYFIQTLLVQIKGIMKQNVLPKSHTAGKMPYGANTKVGGL